MFSTRHPEVVKELANEYRENGLISIYLKTVSAGDQTNQNVIRLKNALSRLEEELEKMGKSSDFSKVLVDLKDKYLTQGNEFWQNQKSSLVIFMNPEGYKVFKLNIDIDDIEVYVDKYYNIRHFVESQMYEQEYYVLCLNDNSIDFYRADMEGMDGINIEGLPKSLSDIVEDSSDGADGGLSLDGIGEKKDIKSKKERKLLDVVAEKLKEYLGDTNLPLVLCGTRETLNSFRDIFEYKHIVEDEVHEISSEAHVHSESWKVIENGVEKYISGEKAQLEDNFAISKLSFNISDVLVGAFESKIEKLFILKNYQIFGTFNDQTLEVQVDEKNIGEDLVNTAIIFTIRNGGKCFFVDEEIGEPTNKLIAVNRY